MTLDQIGLMLAQASKSVPKEKRASFQEVMRSLRTPVGELKSRRNN
jgi:predicted PP-loop superfamily ATPase